MGLFGDSGAEEELEQLRQQIDDIERFQGALRPTAGLEGQPVDSVPAGMDIVGQTELQQDGMKLSPFRRPGAETLDLSSILRQAQMPVENPGFPGGEQPQVPGMPQGRTDKYQDEELLSVLQRLGGTPGSGGRNQLLAGPQ